MDKLIVFFGNIYQISFAYIQISSFNFLFLALSRDVKKNKKTMNVMYFFLFNFIGNIDIQSYTCLASI